MNEGAGDYPADGESRPDMSNPEGWLLPGGRFRVLGVRPELPKDAGEEEWLRAYDTELGREVALRVLPRDAATSESKRLLAVPQLLATLSHPSIPRVLHVGKLADDRPCFALDVAAKT